MLKMSWYPWSSAEVDELATSKVKTNPVKSEKEHDACVGFRDSIVKEIVSESEEKEKEKEEKYNFWDFMDGINSFAEKSKFLKEEKKKTDQELMKEASLGIDLEVDVELEFDEHTSLCNNYAALKEEFDKKVTSLGEIMSELNEAQNTVKSKMLIRAELQNAVRKALDDERIAEESLRFLKECAEVASKAVNEYETKVSRANMEKLEQETKRRLLLDKKKEHKVRKRELHKRKRYLSEEELRLEEELKAWKKRKITMGEEDWNRAVEEMTTNVRIKLEKKEKKEEEAIRRKEELKKKEEKEEETKESILKEAIPIPPAAAIDDCIICYAAPKEYALVPCGHKAYCKSCSSIITDCSVCRVAKVAAIRVYETQGLK